MRSTRIGSVNERFHNRYVIDVISGCWNWSGGISNNGYGTISGFLNGKRYVPKGANMLAHRVSWVLHNGDIPEGEGWHGTVVMHKCDNPKCVNPEHLMLGTQSDNVKDMIVKNRKVAGEFQKRKGIEHFRSAFKNQEDIDLICATVGQTKKLAEKYGVDVCTIKRIRRRNGVVHINSEKCKNVTLPDEAVRHIQNTKVGTRGLSALYGVSNSTISRIRNKFLTSTDAK